MKKFLLALAVATFSLAHIPAFAQEKKSDPTKEESKKPASDPAKKVVTDPAKVGTDPAKQLAPAEDAAKKPDSADAKKDAAKKKVKKGGC